MCPIHSSMTLLMLISTVIIVWYFHATVLTPTTVQNIGFVLLGKATRDIVVLKFGWASESRYCGKIHPNARA